MLGRSIHPAVGGEATKAEQGGFDPTDLGISPLSETNRMVGKSPKPVLRHWYIYIGTVAALQLWFRGLG